MFSCISDADIEEFIEQVTKLQGHGVSPLHNATSELNWSFGQALFFSSTVITTIGEFFWKTYFQFVLVSQQNSIVL